MIEYTVKVNDNCTEWFLNGVLHRENGPAVEWLNGDKSWYKEGELHRDDGPACESVNGSKYWYKEGKRHRLDGPACESVNGFKFWYIEGEMYTEENFNKKIKEMNQPSCDGTIVEIEGKRFELKEIK